MARAAIRHHPAPELLLSYSAGTIPSGLALCVATHLDYCPHCRTLHHRNNAIGGAMLSGAIGSDKSARISEARINESRVSEKSREAVLAAIASRRSANEDPVEEPEVPTPLSEDRSSGKVPRPLRPIIPQGFSGLRWNISTWSVRTCELGREPDGTALSLLKIRAGGKVSRHGHMGDEYTVILTGAFSDEDGLYGPGDFLVRSANEHHTPVATRDGDCICLTAQEAPLQFTGGIWRLFNPILRRNFKLS
jgi:putative transcriptional regulator